MTDQQSNETPQTPEQPTPTEQLVAEQSTPEQSQSGIPESIPQEDVAQYNHEKKAFLSHVRDQGKEIPANFKTADAWFNSLFEAQKNYTQARQEIAELKTQYNENGIANPNYDPNANKPAVETPVAEPQKGEQLQIDAPPEPVQTETSLDKVTVNEWNRWGEEIESNGALTSESRNEIKAKMGVTDEVIDHFVYGRQAASKEAFRTAAGHVGGEENLNNILGWARDNLEPAERDAINSQLRSPSYATTLMGLQQRYNQAASSMRQQEPSPTPNRRQASEAKAKQIVGYASQQEMIADMRNPRYKVDPRFREAVQQRVNASQGIIQGHF